MHPSRQFAIAAALLIPLVSAAPTSPSTRPHQPLSPHSSLWSRENVSRIQGHFDSVLAELRSRDVGTLTATQHARRAQLVATLQDYRDRGVFPHNYDFPGRPTPYFVDRKTGTLCAVANLLASTGRTDIVYRVAATNNNVYVAELAGDTALAGWLNANGLTLAEAERIQIVYVDEPSPATAAGNMILGVAGPVAFAGSLVTSIWNGSGNWDGHARLGRVLGLASGIVSTGMGLSLMGQYNAPRGIGPVMATFGGLSIALATQAIAHHANLVTAERAAARQKAVLQASLAPYVAADGSAGLGMTIWF